MIAITCTQSFETRMADKQKQAACKQVFQLVDWTCITQLASTHLFIEQDDLLDFVQRRDAFALGWVHRGWSRLGPGRWPRFGPFLARACVGRVAASWGPWVTFDVRHAIAREDTAAAVAAVATVRHRPHPHRCSIWIASESLIHDALDGVGKLLGEAHAAARASGSPLRRRRLHQLL